MNILEDYLQILSELNAPPKSVPVKIDKQNITIHFLGKTEPQFVKFILKSYAKWKKEIQDIILEKFDKKVLLTPMIIQVDRSKYIDIYWKMNMKIDGKDVAQGYYNKNGTLEDTDFLLSSNIRGN